MRNEKSPSLYSRNIKTATTTNKHQSTPLRCCFRTVPNTLGTRKGHGNDNRWVVDDVTFYGSLRGAPVYIGSETKDLLGVWADVCYLHIISLGCGVHLADKHHTGVTARTGSLMNWTAVAFGMGL